ncbi:hypothetical protein roselon_02308 [Roseibacterium elongatum DSM 19469]|uniref:Uncharacterized protein n=1 Tax=Roseicyclus elongatus DSM 19469 TaxID=1294273 RepID=W8RTU9_9RHOB|nr:hypothetical protein [Roseibacterium elongatum]AHM04644.1 hypothetical protein roselon_02308 [Roseibacterium elongatum DSM 19469]
MPKILSASLMALLMATPVIAQDIRPLSTTASSQDECDPADFNTQEAYDECVAALPILGSIPSGAIIVGGVVFIGAVAIGLSSSSGTNGT